MNEHTQHTSQGAGKLAGLLEQITQGNWYLCPGDAMQHYRIESPGYVNALEPIATFKGPDRLENGQLCRIAPKIAAALIETVAACEASFAFLESLRGRDNNPELWSQLRAALANARKVTEGGVK